MLEDANTTKTMPFGEFLVNQGVITRDEVEHALQIQDEQKKGYLGSILIEQGFVEEERIIPYLSKHLGINHIKIIDLEIDPSVIEKVPVRVAHFYRVIPLDLSDGRVTLAMSDPQNLRKVDDLRLILGYDIMPLLCGENEIQEALKHHYGIGAETVDRMVESNHLVPELDLAKASMTTDLEELAEDASIIRFVNQVLFEAYRARATDIHIEPYEGRLRIRYRIDGVLYDASIPKEIHQFHQAIVSRLKIMSELDIAERRLPQDGRIQVRTGGEELDLRISILPSYYGEAINIRLLSKSSFLFKLENLGFMEGELTILESLIKKPHGIILVTGPTGSGKTTTLYACLNAVNRNESKIITIEDPIEYQIQGVSQIQVHPKIGLTFSRGLRSMLRHDPDIMMVGEIRDMETAEITIRVALTGHLVFSTLHTNDAASAVTRLIDMGVEPYLVSSSVECIIAQRLVRVICAECKEQSDTELSILKDTMPGGVLENCQIYKGRGCEACRFTGFKGRTAIYEFLILTDEIRDLIVGRIPSNKIKEMARVQGMKTLREIGLEKVRMGITTVGEVLRVTQEEATS